MGTRGEGGVRGGEWGEERGGRGGEEVEWGKGRNEVGRRRGKIIHTL